MTRYIDKDALGAEIERLKGSLSPNFYEYDYDAVKVELLEKIEKFLDTLEIKEVEYIRIDAFVEKACKAFCKVCKMPNCNSKDCSYLKDFRNHMKGE